MLTDNGGKQLACRSVGGTRCVGQRELLSSLSGLIRFRALSVMILASEFSETDKGFDEGCD